MPAPLLPDELEPLEFARRVFDAWRASAVHVASEPLPATLAEIARTLLALNDVDEIVAALDVPPHVLRVGSDAQPTLATSSFVALPALAATDITDTARTRRARHRVHRRHRHPAPRPHRRRYPRRHRARRARAGPVGVAPMILLTHDTPILLGVEPADFREGIDGFQQLYRAALGQDPPPAARSSSSSTRRAP